MNEKIAPCIFCAIIKKQIQAKIILENSETIVFKDINPRAPIHYLIVPKKHIGSISNKRSEQIVGELIKTAKKIAGKEKILGYKLVFNVGKEGGQMVEHLHLHFLAGNKITELP